MKKSKRLLLSKYIPKKNKFVKAVKGKLRKIEYRKSAIKTYFNSFSLVSLTSARINIRHMEVNRLLITRSFIKKTDKLLIRINTSIPISKKPNENRMGKGKGKIATWVSRISAGGVILEVRTKKPKQDLIICSIVSKKFKVVSAITKPNKKS